MRFSPSKRSRYEEFVAADGDGLVKLAYAICGDRGRAGQRAVIVLRYGSQLSEAETAATLEITTGTVKSQTARALARMREVLSPSEPATHELEIA